MRPGAGNESAGLEPGDGTQAVYLQAGLNVQGRRCLVVGGGTVASRKTRTLVEAGAAVTVVAPKIRAMPEGVTLLEREFHEDDLEGATLVVAATDDHGLNSRVAAAACSRGIWVNVADDPDASTLVFPALVRRSALRIAISTGNGSPALARRLRQRLEREFGPEYGDLAELLARLRAEWEPRAKAAGMTQRTRHAAWYAVLDQPLVEMLRQGRAAEAEATARSVLQSYLETGSSS